MNILNKNRFVKFVTIAVILIGAIIFGSVFFQTPTSAPLLKYSQMDFDANFPENTGSVSKATVFVEPESDFVDVPISVRVAGLAPRQTIGLSAFATDANDVQFSSRTVFIANADGVVDTSMTAPVAGTYSTSESSGLLWSMQSDAGQRYAHSMSWGKRTVLIEAKLDRDTVVQKSITRIYPWATINHQAIGIEGFIGDLWLPESEDDLPLVLMLGGFGANTRPATASLFAARGFAVLDLVYHGQPPLPRALEKIPLEYAKEAIDWATRQPGVDASRIGVFGTSKGAEYALLLASKYPGIKAVAAWTPSSVAWAGISFRTPFTRSSWTYNGFDVPYIPAKVDLSTIGRGLKLITGQPAALHDAYAAGFENDVEIATIEVEKISGPILLISGEDDKMWPAAMMSGMIVDRLKSHDFAFKYSHLNFEKTGHTFPWGQWPQGPLDSEGFIRGGEIEPSHAAGREAWFSTIDFFQSELRSK